ncbi:MAG: response regulator [Candidatus Pseudobacter hemicellulosilyticus]|uniref:Response regulator n=1 Tax=Candidatus Pseudobacter hemicellulosilyticus TaxID=3121375 RepID=A0AAJ5WV75_9BACT|nr:MAG: response regulator [Pseudobacter sp.]
MKRRLKCILLIDDDDPTNFLNRHVLERVNCTDRIQVVQSGQEALEYLSSNANRPDLIFLDINMPGMDGWEFLEKYRMLHRPGSNNSIMVMLTTSLNPDDAQRANNIPEVDGYENKPLNDVLLDKILNNFF